MKLETGGIIVAAVELIFCAFNLMLLPFVFGVCAACNEQCSSRKHMLPLLAVHFFIFVASFVVHVILMLGIGAKNHKQVIPALVYRAFSLTFVNTYLALLVEMLRGSFWIYCGLFLINVAFNSFCCFALYSLYQVYQPNLGRIEPFDGLLTIV